MQENTSADKTIHEIHNKSLSMDFYVNDRMSTNEDKNKILFVLRSNSLEFLYFMDILEAEYIINRVLTGRFPINQKYQRSKGKDGTARAITIARLDSSKIPGTTYYQIKIDKGTGTAEDNGFTPFLQKEGGRYITISEREMEELMIKIKKRIRKNELIFEVLPMLKQVSCDKM